MAGATPVTGTLGKSVATGPFAITGVVADPATISPNGDGAADTSTITYTTNAGATVTATLLDATGVQLGTIGQPVRVAAGEHSFTFDGLGQPDGVYTIVITAVDATGVSVTSQLQIAITRTLAAAALRPAVLTPNGDGIGDELAVTLPARRSRHGAPARVARRQVGRDAVHRVAARRPAERPLERRQAGR